MPLNFEWDKTKAQNNLEKHEIRFEEAATVFADADSITIDDPAHSQQERRLITIGRSHESKILVVVHTERGDNIRIISARRANKKERQAYEKT